MIYVVITGRLGNILFQVGAAMSLGKDVTAVSLNNKTREVFLNYKESLFANIGFMDTLPVGVPVFCETSYAYNSIPFNGNSLVLKGFFQSYKYLNGEILKKFFSCPINIKNDILSRYGTIINEKSVAVHVRRGDYLKLPHRHPFCGVSFYKKSIDYFGSQYTFVVCSDDIEWCKHHLKGKNFVYVENSYPLMDLYIQTFCHHNIISNSSFSWWGAYLNPNKDKIVVAPKRWYGHDLKKTNNIKDLLPDDYVMIDCSTSFSQWLLSWSLVCKDKIKKMLR